ncbi:MAG TPA: DUF3667 domain-containing protein [Gemmatimonadaceae bacterium]|nr:DUF3667 domain-containing protein [Gemmatimonadaceae bacterium]
MRRPPFRIGVLGHISTASPAQVRSVNPLAVDAQVAPLSSTYTGTVTQPVAACLNCGTSLTGPFCASCGQRDIPPYPSVRELAVDAFWELSGWDGRFAATVRALVTRPGMLTLEFLEGRRARYLSPLRLYLMASLVYFVLVSAAPDVKLMVASTKPPAAPGSVAGPSPASRPEQVANVMEGSLQNKKDITPAQKAQALADLERAPAVMRPFMRRIILDPTGFKRGLIEMIPRMLFVLLPVFAGLVAVLYRGRKYPEHLYFAIHLNAFLFLALSLNKLVTFTRLPILVGVVGAIVFLWIPIYSTRAFRRVYGGSVTRTLMKEVVIGVVYGIMCLIAFIGVIYWVSLFG